MSIGANEDFYFIGKKFTFSVMKIALNMAIIKWIKLVYNEVLILINIKYAKYISIGANEYFLSYGRNSSFPFWKLCQTWLAPNEVYLVYIEVPNLSCTKYAKGMWIAENEFICALDEKIHFIHTENCARHDLHQMK